MLKRLVFALALTGCSFAPHPGQAASSGPSPTALSPLGGVILAYNNQQAYWNWGVTRWTVAAKGVVVNKITAQQAEAEAESLDNSLPPNAPMSVMLALLASESLLDPSCENGNFLGSNPTHDPLGYDDGVAQLKLRYLIGFRGITTAQQAQAFAFDVARAIPYAWNEYYSKVELADYWIAGNTNSAIDQRLMNRWVLGALIYKQGDTGAHAIFQNGTWPAELNNFVSLEGYFAGKIGQKSVFEGL